MLEYCIQVQKEFEGIVWIHNLSFKDSISVVDGILITTKGFFTPRLVLHPKDKLNIGITSKLDKVQEQVFEQIRPDIIIAASVAGTLRKYAFPKSVSMAIKVPDIALHARSFFIVPDTIVITSSKPDTYLTSFLGKITDGIKIKSTLVDFKTSYEKVVDDICIDDLILPITKHVFNIGENVSDIAIKMKDVNILERKYIDITDVDNIVITDSISAWQTVQLLGECFDDILVKVLFDNMLTVFEEVPDDIELDCDLEDTLIVDLGTLANDIEITQDDTVNAIKVRYRLLGDLDDQEVSVHDTENLITLDYIIIEE